jgi:hypothetical protein
MSLGLIYQLPAPIHSDLPTRFKGLGPQKTKDQRKTTTAVGRELMGFIWAIGIKAEAACKQQEAA